MITKLKYSNTNLKLFSSDKNPMLVVVAPIKFHIPCVNIAGIHYRINRIGIEAVLLKHWMELLHEFPKYQK